MKNIETQIKEKQAMVEQLQEEIKELKKQLKPFTLVCRYIRTIYYKNGEIKTDYIEKTHHHKTQAMALKNMQDTIKRFEKLERCNRARFTEVSFTLNGELI